ncbi:MAG: hypothetical protein ACR2IF_09285 [Terriglobales bacterium]
MHIEWTWTPRWIASRAVMRSLFVLMLVLPALAAAQSPSSGTITPSSSVTWTGTMTGLPPVGINGEAGCTDGTNCEVFTLTVASATWTGSQLSVNISWQFPTSDYDMFVHQGSLDGPIVCQATLGPGETAENCNINPNQTGTGTYVIHVDYATGQGASTDEYHGLITVVPAPPTPQPAPQGSGPLPRYQTYNPPAQSGLGLSAGEPTIGINWTTGRAMFQSDLQTLRVTFFDGSGFPYPRALWENKSPATSQEDSDPMLFTDHVTGRTIAGMLLLLTGRNESSYTDDDGDLWVPSQGSPVNAAIDHETVGGGPYAPPLTRDPSQMVPYPDAVYYCSQDLVTALCARSDDGGQTYGPAVTVYTTECVGLHGHVKVAPDGTVYLPNKQCGQNEAVVVSQDNGITWSVRPVPSSNTSDSDPSVSIGAGGTVYFGWADNDAHPMIAESHDKGNTWSTPLDVGAILGVNGVAFPEVIAGDDNRAAFAFLGSVTPGTIFDPKYTGIFHLYVSHTYDGGATWQTVDATPNDPIQRGPIWFAGGLVTYRNLLDFMDAQIDKTGHVLIASADGCAGAECAQASAKGLGNAYTAFATITRQTGGRPLFSQYDPPNVATLPGPPSVTAGRNGNTVYLGWSTADNGGAPIKNFQIYRGTTSGGETFLKQVKGNVHQFIDTVTGTGKYYYRVVAVNSVGASVGNNEVYAKYVGDSCTGYTVNFDPAGDQKGAPLNADLDLLSVTVSEPSSGLLKFVMKVSSLAPPDPLNPGNLTPDRRWRIVWDYPNGNSSQGQYYLGMSTDDSGVVSFQYGVVDNGVIALVLGDPNESPIGVPDSAQWTPDGTITFTIAKSKVGNPNPGDLLGAVRGLTFADNTTHLRSTLQFDNPFNGTANDESANAAVYVVRNPTCK